MRLYEKCKSIQRFPLVYPRLRHEMNHASLAVLHGNLAGTKHRADQPLASQTTARANFIFNIISYSNAIE